MRKQDDLSVRPQGPGAVESLEERRLLASMTLINTATDQPVSGYTALAQNATIDLAKVGSNLSIRANPDGAPGSVRFGLDANSNFRVESTAPYALGGDLNGDYARVNFTLGTHKVTVTPYSGAGATGTAGTPFSVTFNVINSATQPQPEPEPNPNPTPGAPAAPTGLTAQALSSTEIRIAWADKSTNESQFKIERSTDGRTFYPLAASAANATSYTNRNLTAGRRYYYRVYAINSSGRSADSNVASAVAGSTTTPPPPDTNPTPNPVAGAFKEQNGLVVMEVESAPVAGGWVKETSMSGYTGGGYYTWRGATQFNTPGQGTLKYQVTITNAGKYNFRIHNRHDAADATASNDVFARLNGGSWTKTFSYVRGQWTWVTNFDYGHSNQPQASYYLSAGTHTIEISGRSAGFSIDRLSLYKDGVNGTSTSLPQSPRA